MAGKEVAGHLVEGKDAGVVCHHDHPIRIRLQQRPFGLVSADRQVCGFLACHRRFEEPDQNGRGLRAWGQEAAQQDVGGTGSAKAGLSPSVERGGHGDDRRRGHRPAKKCHTIDTRARKIT